MTHSMLSAIWGRRNYGIDSSEVYGGLEDAVEINAHVLSPMAQTHW